PGHRLLERVVQLRQLLDGVERRRQEEDERREHADRHLAVRRQPGAVAEHDTLPYHADVLGQREGHGARTERPDVRLAPVLAHLTEPASVETLPSEGLYDVYAPHRFLHEREHRRDPLAHPP